MLINPSPQNIPGVTKYAVCSIRKNLTFVGQQVFSDGAQLWRHDISNVSDRVKSTNV